MLQGPLKDWEHYKLTRNGKPVRLPMPMRTGDTVKVISGHDKGKVGKVTKVRAPHAGRYPSPNPIAA